jgi:nitrogen-specific signal transduction histidine kinase/CheY-like chemotaxis protein
LFDVTAERTAALEREALEGHLRQAHKMEAVGQLAGGMAHDFNNLLAVIQNYARFVYEELPESDPKRSDLEEVMKAGARGADLIRQLLTFAREEIVEPEILDINSVISDVSPLVRRVVPDNIEIRTNLQPGISTIEADRGQLDQMLINLAMNATDAMPEGGVLEIRSFDRRVDQISRRGTDELVPGQYVCLTVRDEGSGMSESVLARVFEPFFTTKGRASGPGLGLATVYGIVKRSGGYIDVESTPGEGSTFRIYFPTVGADVRGDAETHTSGQPNGATILVAEDEGAILKIVGRLLERAGYRVLLGETVLEALQLARSDEGIDLLLTDVVMPGQSGKQLSDTVSILRPGIPTLFMSGYPEDILARHDVRADVDNYIQKPFTSEALVAKIGSILGRAAAQPIEAGR